MITTTAEMIRVLFVFDEVGPEFNSSHDRCTLPCYYRHSTFVTNLYKDTIAIVGSQVKRTTVSNRDPEIGDLEADVLKVLKRTGSASAGEIMTELKPGRVLAYTTVSTTLDRLYRKGLVTRRSVSGRTGQKHVYSFPEH